MHTCAWRTEKNLKYYSSRAIHLVFWNMVSHWPRTCHVRLNWLTSLAQEFPFPIFPVLGLQAHANMARFLLDSARLWTQVFLLEEGPSCHLQKQPHLRLAVASSFPGSWLHPVLFIWYGIWKTQSPDPDESWRDVYIQEQAGKVTSLSHTWLIAGIKILKYCTLGRWALFLFQLVGHLRPLVAWQMLPAVS